MPSGGAPWGPRDAAEGPPSERSRASLSDDLRREVADARVRFEEAGLRAETHRLLGDDAAAAAVLAEQEQILADLQDRLGRVVSAAVVQRDAEQVLAEVSAAEPLLGDAPDAPAPRAPAPHHASERRRPPALAGVASMVAILGVATAGVLGLARGLDGVQIAEVSADVTSEDTAPGAPPQAPPATSTGPVAPGPEDRTGDDVPAATTPSATADTAVTGPAPPPEDDAGAPSPGPTPAPDLGTVVEDLIDAVDGLEDPPLDPAEDDTDPPEEVDASAPDVEETVDDLVLDDVDQADDTLGADGFVPDGAAQ